MHEKNCQPALRMFLLPFKQTWILLVNLWQWSPFHNTFSPPGTDQYHYRHKTRLYPFINHKEMYHSAKFHTLQKILLKGGDGEAAGHTHTHAHTHAHTQRQQLNAVRPLVSRSTPGHRLWASWWQQVPCPQATVCVAKTGLSPSGTAAMLSFLPSHPYLCLLPPTWSCITTPQRNGGSLCSYSFKGSCHEGGAGNQFPSSNFHFPSKCKVNVDI